MQLSIIFNNAINPAKIKKSTIILSKEEHFKVSVSNYLKLGIHFRINFKTWYIYESQRTLFEQHNFENTDNKFYHIIYNTGQWK